MLTIVYLHLQLLTILSKIKRHMQYIIRFKCFFFSNSEEKYDFFLNERQNVSATIFFFLEKDTDDNKNIKFIHYNIVLNIF